MVTPPTMARISGIKILTLETTVFGLKLIVKSGLDLFFYFEMCPCLPIQPFWGDLFALGSSNSEGVFQNKKF